MTTTKEAAAERAAAEEAAAERAAVERTTTEKAATDITTSRSIYSNIGQKLVLTARHAYTTYIWPIQP